MSFGKSSRRTGSSGKGSSPKKKDVKKKQEFHTTKRRAGQTDKPDLEKAKERTVTGLDHLGHQKFSVDKGSYGMEGWVKSLNLLLEDFESKLEDGQLPPGYKTQKEALMLRLSTPVDTSELDAKADAIRTEEAAIRLRLQREKERVSARLGEIRTDHERKSKELEVEKTSLVQLVQERQSVSFFSKLTGRRGPPTKPLEDKIEGLSSTLNALEEEEKSLNTAWDSIQKRGTDSPDPYAEDWRRLNEIGQQIVILDNELQEKLQRSKEREEATDELAKMVAGVAVTAPETEEA